MRRPGNLEAALAACDAISKVTGVLGTTTISQHVDGERRWPRLMEFARFGFARNMRWTGHAFSPKSQSAWPMPD
jgi:hypothetical protein